MLPEPYSLRPKLAQVRTTKALAASVETWPRTEVWLVAPRVLRDVPRVAAVWAFLLEAFRAL